mgnify:FL=1|tara:strand:+ start:214 stop:807 length:594 start_codon:yes stop_codon:yes gene_type:complete
MRTNKNNLLHNIVELLTNIDIKKNKDLANKNALLEYIKDEFLNLDEYKALLNGIKLSKEDILEILYQLLTLVNNGTIKYNTQETEQLIKLANNYEFTWPNSNSCFKKVEEEFIELKNAIKDDDQKNIKEEIGDLLFSLHCYTNINKFDYNQILNDANEKFEKRFTKLLEIAKFKNINLAKCSSDKKEELWKEAKKFM